LRDVGRVGHGGRWGARRAGAARQRVCAVRMLRICGLERARRQSTLPRAANETADVQVARGYGNGMTSGRIDGAFGTIRAEAVPAGTVGQHCSGCCRSTCYSSRSAVSHKRDARTEPLCDVLPRRFRTHRVSAVTPSTRRMTDKLQAEAFCQLASAKLLFQRPLQGHQHGQPPQVAGSGNAGRIA
jgi:hypothetical protein